MGKCDHQMGDNYGCYVIDGLGVYKLLDTSQGSRTLLFISS